MQISTGLDDATFASLQTSLSNQPVSREFHAFCRLCPPSAGRRLLELEPAQLSQLSQQCRVAVDAWLSCDRSCEVMPDVPSLTTRESSLPGKTKTRDGTCVITGSAATTCEISHIIPYGVGKSQARRHAELWKVLQMFWGEEHTSELQNLVFGPEDLDDPNRKTLVNRLYNVLTLSSDAHTYWAEGYFVLEPHPDPGDQYTQRAIFRWVYPHASSRLEPGVFAPIDLAADVPELATDVTGGEGPVYLIDCRATLPGRLGQLIHTNHTVTFRTDDPIARPLPSRELLLLQNCLIRVLRMAGRAGWDMREMNYSDMDVDSIDGNENPERSSWCSPTAAVHPTVTNTNHASSDGDTPAAPPQSAKSHRVRRFFGRVKNIVSVKPGSVAAPHSRRTKQPATRG